jgi:hypothetical protein
MIALVITSFVLVAVMSYYIGKHQERIEWNKLIKDGILPKPRQPRLSKDEIDYWITRWSKLRQSPKRDMAIKIWSNMESE